MTPYGLPTYLLVDIELQRAQIVLRCVVQIDKEVQIYPHVMFLFHVLGEALEQTLWPNAAFKRSISPYMSMMFKLMTRLAAYEAKLLHIRLDLPLKRMVMRNERCTKAHIPTLAFLNSENVSTMIPRTIFSPIVVIKAKKARS